MGHDPQDKRFPFKSGLEELPKLAWDVPWGEINKAPHLPAFVYETQISNRTKYRAEFPMRVAALGIINDFDIINWHIYGHMNGDPDATNPWSGPINTFHDNFGFSHDEVQQSSMLAAAHIFRNGLLSAAPNPTTFVFGRRTLYDPASMDYGKSFGDNGRAIAPTTYRNGSRVLIDPSREDDAVLGPKVNPRVFESNPLRPTNEIEFDWQKGHLTFDAPGVAMYTGFAAQHNGPLRFTNGVTLREIKIVNPPNIAFPVKADEGYIEFSLVSTDGQPLNRTKKAMLSLVSTSFNTGYRLDVSRPYNAERNAQAAPLNEFFGAPETPGWTDFTVIVARVGATVGMPMLNGTKYTLRDFNLKVIGSGTVKNGTFTMRPEQPVFVVEFTR
jgi:hypothetical protein